MATSPNYGWEEPDDTDLVKDGALSIRTLGNAIDSTVGTALNNKLHAGLVLVKTQSVGAGVSSVTVTDAFNSTYENYKIVYSGGVGSASVELSLKLGSTATGYYANLIYQSYGGGAISGLAASNASNWYYVGFANTTAQFFSVEVLTPQLAKWSQMRSGWASAVESGTMNGVLKDTTQYTSFSIVVNGGTITGGTIYVYGYAKD